MTIEKMSDYFMDPRLHCGLKDPLKNIRLILEVPEVF